MERVFCSNCNSYRFYEHIYCYVCGNLLIKEKPKSPIKREIFIGKCIFCGKEIDSVPHNRRSCNDPVCRKLSNRLSATNNLRVSQGLPKLETYDTRFCTICSNPIPLNKQSNSKVKFCSPFCQKLGRSERSAKFYLKHRERLSIYYRDRHRKMRELANGKNVIS